VAEDAERTRAGAGVSRPQWFSAAASGRRLTARRTTGRIRGARGWRQQLFVAALTAAQPRETVGQNAAFEEGVELVLDESRRSLPMLA
jgi:hypothetical protein